MDAKPPYQIQRRSSLRESEPETREVEFLRFKICLEGGGGGGGGSRIIRVLFPLFLFLTKET
jgi:hypothetical protein